jgi:hypothetical protein
MRVLRLDRWHKHRRVWFFFHFSVYPADNPVRIIATMLGRLGMTVDECIRAYENVGQAAFTPKRTRLPIAPPKGAFSAKALEVAVKKVVRDNCTEPQCVMQRRQGQPTVDTCSHEDLRLRDTTCTKTYVVTLSYAMALSTDDINFS